MVRRSVAIAVPARDERERIAACLQSLAGLDRDERVAGIDIVVVANNCSDDTAAVARAIVTGSADVRIQVLERDLPAARAHAGWARRLALDGATYHLQAPGDVLLCTDADTLVAKDWLVRTLDHLDRGFDAVAGHARLRADEFRNLPRSYRERLNRLRRYEAAFDYVRASLCTDEAWPRHFFEGGASIALTLASYLAIGGAPTPPVSEDKALFDALRRCRFRIRHAKDVRVFTSCRLEGRAPGGVADTLARWGVQDDDEGLWGLRPVDYLMTPTANDEPLSFSRLDAETRKARDLVRRIRAARRLDEAI